MEGESRCRVISRGGSSEADPAIWVWLRSDDAAPPEPLAAPPGDPRGDWFLEAEPIACVRARARERRELRDLLPALRGRPPRF